MRLTLACFLFIVICMTVSARFPYGYGSKDKKGWLRRATGWARSIRWGEQRGFAARQDKPEEMYAEMFKALDEDQDGFVDIDELRDDMSTVLKGETRTPEELMVETDTNGDGKVDFEEFVNDIMSDNPQKRMCYPPFFFGCGK